MLQKTFPELVVQIIERQNNSDGSHMIVNLKVVVVQVGEVTWRQ